MRASKINSQKSDFRGQNFKNHEIHISGAEGIYEEAEILKIVKGYAERALNHPRGRPDKIVITIEELDKKPKNISLLPLQTIKCDSPSYAEQIITQMLFKLGISKKAIYNAFRVLRAKQTMRGAAIIAQKSGLRLEPDKSRGIRVSRLGIEKSVYKKISKLLSGMKINTSTVKEALILASKVASCPDVISEICISDDPDYTTGYIASKKLGYLRIPNIKRRGDMNGGRVFFIKEDADINNIINYLEMEPVIAVCENLLKGELI